VIVIPSMIKMAIGIGGSYGRGAMVCRTGTSFDGPWGAPAIYTLEGGSVVVRGAHIAVPDSGRPLIAALEKNAPYTTPPLLSLSIRPCAECCQGTAPLTAAFSDRPGRVVPS
jgi:hypothetical protein